MTAAAFLLRFETSEEFDPNSVTPGVVGFIAIFLIAAVTVLLLLDMTRRIRRTRYRGEVREKLDAEERDSRNTDSRPDDPRYPDGD